MYHEAINYYVTRGKCRLLYYYGGYTLLINVLLVIYTVISQLSDIICRANKIMYYQNRTIIILLVVTNIKITQIIGISYSTGTRDIIILHRSSRALCARGLSAICRHRSRVHVL